MKWELITTSIALGIVLLIALTGGFWHIIMAIVIWIAFLIGLAGGFKRGGEWIKRIRERIKKENK